MKLHLSYLQYNTVTNIEIVTEIPAEFPVITICNLNQYQTNYSFDIVQKYSNYSILNTYKRFFLMNELLTINDSFKKSIGIDVTTEN